MSADPRDAAPRSEPGETVFVGRAQELRILRHAWRQARGGRAITAVLHGRSGLGKSAIANRFLEELAESAEPGTPPPVVLAGRCYAQQGLGYQGLSEIFEALLRHLRGLDAGPRRDLLPRSAWIIPRVFPFFAELPDLPAPEGAQEPDLQETRARAVQALRELLVAVCARGGAVLSLDDAHHADRETLELLLDLTAPPGAPAAMAILCVTDDDLDEHAPVTTAMGALRRRDGTMMLPVGELTAEESEELVAELLGRKGDGSPVVAQIVAEAHGNPLFLGELSRVARQTGSTSDSGPTQLEEVLAARVRRLGDSARLVLELIAIAGEPVSLDVMARALGLRPEEAERAAAHLRVDGLVRDTGSRDRLEVEHERIRACVLEALGPAEQRQCHELLATALEEGDATSVEALARHWLAAGDPARARRYARQAGEVSASKLAFDRAAGFFRAALDVAAADPADDLELLEALAESLALAGRSAEAADVYGRAAALATGERKMRLDVQRTDQLLRSGHIVDGLSAAGHALRQMGLHVPRSTYGALLSSGVRRALVSLRGLRWRPHAADVSTEELNRLEILWTLAMGLSVVDHIRGADFNSRYLLRALSVGDPVHVARALTAEASFLAANGKGLRAAACVEEAERQAELAGDPSLLGFVKLARGIYEYFSNHFSMSAQTLRDAETELRDHGRGKHREVGIARQFLLFSLMYRGAVDELQRRLKAYIGESERRGDLFSLACIRGRTALAWLAADDPGEAERNLDAALEGWPRGRGPYYVQHWYEFFGRTELRLYVGDAAGAARLIDENWRPMHRALLTQIPLVKGELWHGRGRAALGLALARPAERSRHLRMAARCARTCDAVGTDLSLAFGRLLAAGIAAADANAEGALPLLREAQVYFESTGALMWSTATMRTLGSVLGGDEGAALTAEANRRYGIYGVRAPDRITGLMVPGFGVGEA